MSLATLAVVFALAAPPAEGERLLRQEVVVDAPPAEVWKMFVTEEGIRAWQVPWVRVDLRVGGTIETSYDPDATPGAPNNIVQRVLAYEPGVMLAAQLDRVPDDSSFKEGLAGVWGVTRLEPLPGDRTRVVATMLGWPAGEAADRAYAFFERMNPTVHAKLRAHFADRRPDGAATMAALRRTIGTWVHERDTEGGKFRAVNVIEPGPSDESLLARSWIGIDGIEPHGATLIWIEPGEGVVRFASLDERAAVTEGTIRLRSDEQTLEWDWRSRARDGSEDVHEVTTRLEGDDVRVMGLRREGDVDWRTLEYRRIAALPDAFRRALEERED